jgi:preprotein translocase subunit SecE
MTARNPNKEDTKKLTFVVIFMSMFVLVLYGLGPLV